ncbi:MAG: hypothetical protein IKU10_03595, partial [Clostridia bacterium]|nr:hypothetical protein [Clostridia bacterium]
SHILSELQLVANKYGIISKGKLICEITAEELRQQCGTVTVVEAADHSALLAQMQSMWSDCSVESVDNQVRIVGEINLNDTLKAIMATNNEIKRVQCTKTDFEEYYLSLIGGGHRG